MTANKIDKFYIFLKSFPLVETILSALEPHSPKI